MSTEVIGSSSFDTTPDVNGTLVMLNAGGTPSISSGLLSARPAVGTTGRLYIATDNNVLYRDTGTVWETLSSNDIDVSFSGGTTPYVSTTSTSFAALGRIVWRGSNIYGVPTSVVGLAWVSAANRNVSFRVQDVTNALTVGTSATATNTTVGMLTISTLSNVSTGAAIWEIQAMVGGGAGTVYMSGVSIWF